MSWHVARTDSNRERHCDALPTKYRVETFLPMVEQRVIITNKRTNRPARTQVRPVLAFPGYIFVNFTDMDAWHRAKKEWGGFAGLLRCNSDGVECLGDTIVEDIKTRLVNGCIPLTESASPFHVGQKVRVARGKYVDLLGSVESTADLRVGVLLSFFNQPVSVTLDASLVIAA